MPVDEPLWYKDAIFYELHVRSFFDSTGSGTGDLTGLTQKLDYLQDLGVNVIWLLPFYPSPLRDDGYDIADYASIHPEYGTLDSFREFLAAAHSRGLRVITELVINHTSDQHPWFRRARQAPVGSVERDFYVWSDTPEKYRDARIIFKDYEMSNWTYDHVAKAYFWHRFYSHQPDLNYDNPAVWEAIFPLLDYWFGMGVDGMRLDAVPYLYEREGTNCENLPETHKFLKALRRHVDERFPNRMLLAEANQWPEDAVAYFGSGDECHMAFHFPIMPRLFMSIHREDRYPLIDIMEQTPAIPDVCQWALFLRNHDELTLEMVTDEERDYMYRAYAQDVQARINLGIRRRLAPLLGNNRRRVELMNGLLFSLPGTPVIYYGDEIGMGDNIYLGDRNGVRTPMQWSTDRNAGFSRANPQKLYLPIIIDPEYHYESLNVEAQQNNPHSLLWWMKRLIDMRKRHKAFGRGQLEALDPSNRKILAFLRTYEDETLLVVANLSRFVQYVELDLSRFEGRLPIELFGNTPFPRISTHPYMLTLAPHSFYWFKLSDAKVELGLRPALSTPNRVYVPAGRRWQSLLTHDPDELEVILPRFLQHRNWDDRRQRSVYRARVRDAVPLKMQDDEAMITLIDADGAGEPVTCVLPLRLATGERGAEIMRAHPEAVLALVEGETPGVLYDAAVEPAFGLSLLESLQRGAPIKGTHGGELHFAPMPKLDPLLADTGDHLHVTIMPLAQSNVSFDVAGRVVLKVLRNTQPGPHPDVELGQALSEDNKFAHSPELVGVATYRFRRAEPYTVAIAHGFIPNQGDAWQYTLDAVSVFYEKVLSLPGSPPTAGPFQTWFGIGDARAAGEATANDGATKDLCEEYLGFARLLGQRTAEMHIALASLIDHTAFAPEPFTMHYQRSLYQSTRGIKREVFGYLRHRKNLLPPDVREPAQQLLAQESHLMNGLQSILARPMATNRIRVHGDYHLGQVLCTGKDVVIIDFEGPATHSIGERRLKRSPLRDVASMLRSFDYAARSTRLGLASGRGRPAGIVRAEDMPRLTGWARCWYSCVARAFWVAYAKLAREASLLPSDESDTRNLLFAFVLEEGLHELLHELEDRPAWIAVPLEGLLDHLATAGSETP